MADVDNYTVTARRAINHPGTAELPLWPRLANLLIRQDGRAPASAAVARKINAVLRAGAIRPEATHRRVHTFIPRGRRGGNENTRAERGGTVAVVVMSDGFQCHASDVVGEARRAGG